MKGKDSTPAPQDTTTRVVERYDKVPHFGVIEIVENLGGESLHGKYFARVHGYGIAGRFSDSPQQAREGASSELLTFVNGQISQIELSMAGLKQVKQKAKGRSWKWLEDYKTQEQPENGGSSE